MAAPGIPNLNTLLGSRGAGRGRGRGRRLPSQVPPEEPGQDKKDEIIQRTDGDASGSRLSAVNLRYLKDEFARFFYQDDAPPRRYPIINRGTYVRTSAIDRLVDDFIATNPDQKKQIVSLGAGSDTRFFRIVSSNQSVKLMYHEFDFPTNTASKIQTIKSAPSLISAIKEHSGDADSLVFNAAGTELVSPTYLIHALDLRSLAEQTPPQLPNLDPTLPTLLLSECCLCYLSPSQSQSILRTFESIIKAPLGLVIYEPIRPNDPFGRTMISNLASRGIQLQTLQQYATLGAQRLRLKDAGLSSGQNAGDIEFVWEKWVSKEEKDRVARCEMMDEVEEWILLARHYCIVWGWREDGVASFGKAWGSLPAQDGD